MSLSIEFDFDSARVRSKSLPVLNNLAQALKSPALKDARFLIEGHTDGAGRADYNQRLSAQRAQAVSSLLASQGVAASRLSTVGKGSSDLANASDPAAAENRRVKIVNLD
ncbi:MAG: OmpA family protein [Cytophagales bacterium]|nr:OmpA family protein [Rhizobacter sp.]